MEEGGIIMRRSRRFGFTLVELILVVIIIGALVGVLAISISPMADSAKASTLLSDLRNMQAAGLIWLGSNVISSDLEMSTEWTSGNMGFNLKNYVDNNRKLNNIKFIHIPGVGYLVGESNVAKEVILKALSQTSGVAFLDEFGMPITNPTEDATVCFKVKR